MYDLRIVILVLGLKPDGAEAEVNNEVAQVFGSHLRSKSIVEGMNIDGFLVRNGLIYHQLYGVGRRIDESQRTDRAGFYSQDVVEDIDGCEGKLAATEDASEGLQMKSSGCLKNNKVELFLTVFQHQVLDMSPTHRPSKLLGVGHGIQCRVFEGFKYVPPIPQRGQECLASVHGSYPGPSELEVNI